MIVEVASDTVVEVLRERRSANIERASDAIRDAQRATVTARALWRRAQSSMREVGEHVPLHLIEDAAGLGHKVQGLADQILDACEARNWGAKPAPLREVVSNG